MPEFWGDALSNPQGGMFSNLWQNANNSLENNPEMFSIFMDKIGTNLDPKNPFAGIGTSFGQSSLMNKAKQQQDADKKSWMDKLISAAGGMTPQGLPGVNNIKSTLDKDGTPEVSMSFNPPSNSKLGSLGSMVQQPPMQTQQPQQQQQQMLNGLFGVSPF